MLQWSPSCEAELSRDELSSPRLLPTTTDSILGRPSSPRSSPASQSQQHISDVDALARLRAPAHVKAALARAASASAAAVARVPGTRPDGKAVVNQGRTQLRAQVQPRDPARALSTGAHTDQTAQRRDAAPKSGDTPPSSGDGAAPATASSSNQTEDATRSGSVSGTTTEGGAPNGLSGRLTLTTALFDLLSGSRGGGGGSGTGGVDHPLCKECTHGLLELMAAQLDEVRRTRDVYISFDAELRRLTTGSGNDEAFEGSEVEIQRVSEAVLEVMGCGGQGG